MPGHQAIAHNPESRHHPGEDAIMPAENKLAAKRKRCEQVNQAIQIIASHGRRFFFSESKQTYASMQVDDRGKV
jgi:hypothetical protein